MDNRLKFLYFFVFDKSFIRAIGKKEPLRVDRVGISSQVYPGESNKESGDREIRLCILYKDAAGNIFSKQFGSIC